MRKNLFLHKDYELIQPCLLEALFRWNNIVAKNCIERYSLKKSFSGQNFDRKDDFPGENFVELYPPLIQFLEHSTIETTTKETIGF